jgi:hypothetical protein
VHGLNLDDPAVALGLDDAQAADDRVLVDRDTVHALVFRCLGDPGLQAYRLEQFADQVLELHRLERQQVPSPDCGRSPDPMLTTLGWPS